MSSGRSDANVHGSLANIEMRLILAKMLWYFDFALADEKQKWIEDQMIYTTVTNSILTMASC